MNVYVQANIFLGVKSKWSRLVSEQAEAFPHLSYGYLASAEGPAAILVSGTHYWGGACAARGAG